MEKFGKVLRNTLGRCKRWDLKIISAVGGGEVENWNLRIIPPRRTIGGRSDNLRKYVENMKKYVENMYPSWWRHNFWLSPYTFGEIAARLKKIPSSPAISPYFLNFLSLRACTEGRGKSPWAIEVNFSVPRPMRRRHIGGRPTFPLGTRGYPKNSVHVRVTLPPLLHCWKAQNFSKYPKYEGIWLWEIWRNM